MKVIFKILQNNTMINRCIEIDNRPDQKPMKLTQKNVINTLIDGFAYEINTKQNRILIIDKLKLIKRQYAPPPAAPM